MLFVRPELHDITGTDFLDRSALALHAASASRDDKRLTYRMRMPGRPGAWLLTTASQPQNSSFGFTGDPDGIPEPILWLQPLAAP